VEETSARFGAKPRNVNITYDFGPSWHPSVLKMILTMMLAQAQECHWKTHLCQVTECNLTPEFKEAAAVAKMYLDAKKQIAEDEGIASKLPRGAVLHALVFLALGGKGAPQAGPRWFPPKAIRALACR
jgi:hypothetical protein